MQSFRYPLMVTAIGSLPFETADEALELIEKTLPQCPHWPQLPVHREEYFITQFLAPLRDMVNHPPGKNPRFRNDEEDFLDRVTGFYETYLRAREGDEEAFEKFAFPPLAARGFYAFMEHYGSRGERPPFVKGQIIGPVTAGFQLYDSSGRGSFYDPQLRDLLMKCLEMQLAWQTRKLKSLGAQPIVFIDDALLNAFGQQTFISLQRQDILDAFSIMTDAIRREGGIPGAHVCAGADWSLLFESDIDILNLDAYSYFPSLLVYTDGLKDFLARGKVVTWGIVPTSEAAWEETAESLADRLRSYFLNLAGKGFDLATLYRQAIISPACGCGTLRPETARRIYQLTVGVSDLLKPGIEGHRPT